jgi:hypothetical protein
MSRQRFTREFDEWCKLTQPPDGLNKGPDWKDFAEFGPPTIAVEKYISSITQDGVHWANLSINSPNSSFGGWDVKFHSGKEPSLHQINLDAWDVAISGHFDCLNVSGLTAWQVHLIPHISPKPVKFVNCLIGKLLLQERNRGGQFSLELENCWIGTLVLPEACLKNLTITRGGVAKIDCPPGESPNPFKGAVVFKHVFFPTSSHQTSLFEGPQGYRNLHAHLRKHDNMLMANQMRTHQLRSERSDEQGFAKLTNWIYGSFANYGTSPGRPLWWLLGLYISVFVFIYTFDCGTLTQSIGYYVGAYTILLDENGGRLSRSLLLPLNSIVNPFGIFFDSRKPIVPSTSYGSILLTVQGLFSDVLVLMIVLSIRRRFKAE